MQGQPAPAGISDAAARDTLAAVFRHADYDRSLRDTVLGRILSWVGDWLRGLLRAAREAAGAAPRPVYVAAVVLLALLAALIVARLVYAAYLRRERGAWAAGRARGAAGAAGGDAWAAAQSAAAAGDHTAAAHLLYRALLEALAARERLRLHPSKTVGDYARDLRRRSSTVLGRYREFGRAYESVVYGGVPCDRDRFERLRALAAPVVGRDA